MISPFFASLRVRLFFLLFITLLPVKILLFSSFFMQRTLQMYDIIFVAAIAFAMAWTGSEILVVSKLRKSIIISDVGSSHSTVPQNATQHAMSENATLESILTSIGDGVFAVNTEGRIILINEVAQELSGFNKVETFGRHYAAIFRFIWEKSPDSSYPDFIEDVIKQGITKKMSNHTVLIAKAGRRVPVTVVATPMKQGEATVGSVVVVHDVSHERALEEAKDNFLSIAAHDLRTPLGSMRWTLEVLLKDMEGNMPDAQKETIHQLYVMNQRMISLVNGLLNASRIEQGMIRDNPESIDVKETIEEQIRDLQLAADKRSIGFELAIIPSDAQVHIIVDSPQFQEVIQNLLSNAVKYSNSGGKIYVTIKKEADELLISVADQGIGIPKSDQMQMFSRLYRGQNAIRSDTEGNGLGLFVVKSYVERWGGKVWFVSEEGRGSTFSFTIPLPQQTKS